MRTRNRKLIWVALVIILLLVLTGCSPNQREIFNASMKLKEAKSLQEHTTMTFQVSGSDFDPAVQQQVDKTARFLNNAKLDLDVKTYSNEQKTASKAQMNINLALQGMNIDLPVWLDSDLTGDVPKVKEIIKLPSVASASLPPEFSNKEYMVLNPYDMNNAAGDNITTMELMNFSKNMQTSVVNFMNSYAQQYNPGFEVIDNGIQSLQTDTGLQPARVYEVKLNDAQFKDFIRYTVNNFVQDNDAVNFVKQFMDSTLQLSQSPNKATILNNFDQAFAKFYTDRPQFLATFNNAMDSLQNVSILGDKGIDIQYGISGGCLVKESGSVNLNIDLAQINQFINALNGQQNTLNNPKGTLNLTVNFNTKISGINNQAKIQLPTVDSTNSFNYSDLLNAETLLK